MKNIILTLIVISFLFVGIPGQDMFKAVQLTFDSSQEGFPTWSPDGEFIIYSTISTDDTSGKTGLRKIANSGIN